MYIKAPLIQIYIYINYMFVLLFLLFFQTTFMPKLPANFIPKCLSLFFSFELPFLIWNGRKSFIGIKSTRNSFSQCRNSWSLFFHQHVPDPLGSRSLFFMLFSTYHLLVPCITTLTDKNVSPINGPKMDRGIYWWTLVYFPICASYTQRLLSLIFR